MSFYRFSHHMSGFGLLMPSPIPPGWSSGTAILTPAGPDAPVIAFLEQWSLDDYFKNSWNSDYNPYTGTTTDAQAKYQALEDAIGMGSPSAPGILKGFVDRMNAAVTMVDNITRAGYYGKGQQQAAARIAAYYALSQALADLTNVAVPDPDAEAAAAEAAADAETTRVEAVKAKSASDAAAKVASTAAVAAKRTNTAASIAAAKDAIAAAAQAKAAADAAVAAHTLAAQVAVQKHADTVTEVKTPLIIAAVAIPVLIIAFMAFNRKKSTPVAGYRRRRSRR